MGRQDGQMLGWDEGVGWRGGEEAKAIATSREGNKGECERLRSCVLESKLFVTAASEFTRSYFRRSVAHCSMLFRYWLVRVRISQH